MNKQRIWNHPLKLCEILFFQKRKRMKLLGLSSNKSYFSFDIFVLKLLLILYPSFFYVEPFQIKNNTWAIIEFGYQTFLFTNKTLTMRTLTISTSNHVLSCLFHKRWKIFTDMKSQLYQSINKQAWTEKSQAFAILSTS